MKRLNGLERLKNLKKLRPGKAAVFIVACAAVLLAGALWAAAANPIRLVVNGSEVAAVPAPFISEGRVFVPVRFVAEALGASVNWDAAGNTVAIDNGDKGSQYMKGAASYLVMPQVLLEELDDDKDVDLADYRKDHTGGDKIDNDPLIVDVRTKQDWDTGHIPTAVWIDTAENMLDQKNIATLDGMLADHYKQGGKSEVIIYDGDGYKAALLCGMLGARGMNVKCLEFGYDIGWAGTKTAPVHVSGTIEDKSGNARTCGG